MIRDIRTVMWKEWKGLFRQRGSRTKMILTLLTPVAAFAIYFPWEAPEAWLHGPLSMFASIALPLIMTLLTIPDSFAGERERHTLATLLASRLPDRAVLFGKVAYAVAFAWGVALLALALGVVTANVTHWTGELQFYSPKIALANVLMSFLIATLTVGIGVLLSLRAATVQEAQQTLSAALILPPTILGPVFLVIATTKPEWTPRALLRNVDPTDIFVSTVIALAIVDIVLLALALARFQRAKLILR